MGDHQLKLPTREKLKLKRTSSFAFLPPHMSELRVVLLGNNWSVRNTVGNCILEETKFDPEDEPDCCVMVKGQFKDKGIVLVNTPDLLQPNISEKTLKEHVKNCMRLSAPGPHVFLLVLQSEDFTDEHSRRLCMVFNLFGHQSFDHSLVLITTQADDSADSSAYLDLKEDHPLKEIVGMCRNKYLTENLERSVLLTNLGQTAKEKNGQYIRCEGFEDEYGGLFMSATSESEDIKPALNLVLFGRGRAQKISAARAILGQTAFQSVSEPSECVLRRGDVCGRQLTLVELPDLSGKSEEEVNKDSFRCVSLCDPEGVHAFILVVPVEPLTDEDKQELQIIQNTFGSRVNDLTVVLFTVKSDWAFRNADRTLKENKDVQELLKNCGGRYVVLNMKDKQQIPELLDTVEKMKADGSQSFTKDTFTKVLIDKFSQLKAEPKDVKQKNKMGGGAENLIGDRLRVVLVGRSGGGKSATANTILGKKHFQPRITPKPATKFCERATGEIDGQIIDLVVTPALFGTTLTDDEIQQEFQRCLTLLSPGPHVFLLVLQIGSFKQAEKESLELIKKHFGKKSEDFVIIIFTRGDELEDQSFESYIEDCDSFVKQLVDDCGGRYQLFNNKETKRPQVRELVTKIESMVRKNGGCYNPDRYQKTNISGSIADMQDVQWRSEIGSGAENQTGEHLRVVLIGRSGGGKNATANTILGKKHFQPRIAPKPATKFCEKATGEIDGRPVDLVVTPALFETTLTDDEIQQEFYKCFTMLSPGPHVFLLVLQIGSFIPEEETSMERIKKYFGKKSEDFVIIIFTRGDELGDQSLESYIEECGGFVKQLVDDCGGRYQVFNNKETNRTQVRELASKIKTVMRENGGCYKTAMFPRIKLSGSKTEPQTAQWRSRAGSKVEYPIKESLRVVLIGRSGGGKNATANTILGKKHFQPRIAPKPATKFCEKATGEIDGRDVDLVVTPGLFETTLTDDEIQQELQRCFTLLSPGPHVFLLVLQIGNFKQEEQASVELIRKVFGKKSEDYIIIVFTRGDELEDQSLESYIEECDSFVKQLVDDCGGRYQVFNNKETNRTQVRELVTKIESMVRKNGGCYKTEMFQWAKEAIQRELENVNKRHDEEMQQMKSKLDMAMSEIDHRSKMHGDENLEEIKRLTQEVKDIKLKQAAKNKKCSIS